MRQTNGIFNEDLNKYIDGWAKKMIDIWQEKMLTHAVGTSPNASGNLYNSLKALVNPQHDRIDLAFNFYGYYVEYGIGPEFGEKGKLGSTRNVLRQLTENPKRQAKPWMSGSFWYSKEKLKAEMLRQTGTLYLKAIASTLEESS